MFWNLQVPPSNSAENRENRALPRAIALTHPGTRGRVVGSADDLLFRWGDLMSLYDLLQVYAERYVQIGLALESMAGYGQRETEKNVGAVLIPTDFVILLDQLKGLKTHCDELDLAVSGQLIELAASHLRRCQAANVAVGWSWMTHQIDFLTNAFQAELKKRTFLALPAARAEYYSITTLSFGETMLTSFPSSATELKEASRCFALGLDTASVFHSMRALETPLTALAKSLGVSHEYENWKTIIDRIESKIPELEQLPKGDEKSALFQFCSEAAKEFRYFREAWRNHVMHARGVYEYSDGLKTLRHARDFVEHLATKFSDAN
jgi:hypothetical protein